MGAGVGRESNGPVALRIPWHLGVEGELRAGGRWARWWRLGPHGTKKTDEAVASRVERRAQSVGCLKGPLNVCRRTWGRI